jgi:hypothetical protein
MVTSGLDSISQLEILFVTKQTGRPWVIAATVLLAHSVVVNLAVIITIDQWGGALCQ